MSISKKSNSKSNHPATNIIINSAKQSDISIPDDCTVKVEYVNGKKEGAATVFSSKMTRVATLTYHNDIVEGHCVFFDEDGKKIREGIYEGGIHNGWGCEYENSRVVFTGFYKNGERYSELRLNGNDSYVEEVIHKKTVSFCKYTKDHKRDGLCYLYKDGELECGILYNSGVKGKKVFEIKNGKLYEYDEEDLLVYRGDYRLSNTKPPTCERYGYGYAFKYANMNVSRIDHFFNKSLKNYYVLNGDQMKEYNADNQLIYEGGYVKENDIPKRNQKGYVYTSTTHYYSAIFKDGKEIRREQLFDGNMLVEYDSDNKIVYKGDYNKEKKRSGSGFVFHYDNKTLVDVFKSDNGIAVSRCYHFDGKVMSEFEDNSSMIYKGGYSGDCFTGFERHDNGELYNSEGMLIYKGDWKNNRRHGKGKFYSDGMLVYDGHVKNDVPDGMGSRFNADGDIIHQGYWHNGYIEDGKTYIHFLSLNRCGFHDDYSLRYEGSWKGDLPDGEGILYTKQGEIQYKGQWRNGLFSVSKELTYNYGKNEWTFKHERLKYVGAWAKDQPNGWGVVYDSLDHKLFCGEWEDGSLVLHGNLRYNFLTNNLFTPNRSVNYEGEWKNGMFVISKDLYYDYKDKKMVKMYNNGMKYIGRWENDAPEGEGSLYKDNKYIASGSWKNGVCKVKDSLSYDIKKGVYIHYSSGGRYEGDWENDKPHGKGVMYKGNKKYKGKWKEGVHQVHFMTWYNYDNDRTVSFVRFLFKYGFIFDLILLALGALSLSMFSSQCEDRDCRENVEISSMIVFFAELVFFGIHLLYCAIAFCSKRRREWFLRYEEIKFDNDFWDDACTRTDTCADMAIGIPLGVLSALIIIVVILQFAYLESTWVSYMNIILTFLEIANFFYVIVRFYIGYD